MKYLPRAETGMTREKLDHWARVLIHTVHRADEAQKGPFKDDEDYSAYLWKVSRELFEFYKEVLRKAAWSDGSQEEAR